MTHDAAIDLVKAARAHSGLPLEEHFARKHSNIPAIQVLGWTATSQADGCVVVEYTVQGEGLSPTRYRWEVVGERIIAVNGHAMGATPDLAKPMTKEEREAGV